MKKFKIIIIVLFFILSIIVISTSKKTYRNNGIAIGMNAPDILIQDISTGKEIFSDNFKGKVLFVNFWASWCPPCREEMPSIEALYREMSQNSDFKIITILYKDSIQNGVDYMKSKGYTFPVYADITGNSSKNYGVTGVPETFIIDKKGILQKRVIGAADWNSIENKTMLKNLLNEE